MLVLHIQLVVLHIHDEFMSFALFVLLEILYFDLNGKTIVLLLILQLSKV